MSQYTEATERRQEISRKARELVGNELITDMFSSFAKAIHKKQPFPTTHNDFHFDSFFYAPSKHSFTGKGSYYKNGIHFQFEIEIFHGLGAVWQIESFELLSASVKKCSCSWDLVKRNGCKCGAIKPYKPKI